MDSRPDIPDLSFVTATSYSNPAWYIIALVAGGIGFFAMLRHMPSDMNLFAAIVTFIVLPFGIPAAIVALLTWYTDWQVDEQGVTKRRFGRGERRINWSEVQSATFLPDGRTELIAGARRTTIPGKNLLLTASVWQHLRSQKRYTLPETIAPLWNRVSENLPEEVIWENPCRPGFWTVWGGQILRLVIFMAFAGILVWRGRTHREMSDLSFWLMWFLVLISSPRNATPRRVKAGPSGLAAECPGHQPTNFGWNGLGVRFTRKTVTISAYPQVVIPITSSDETLPVLLALIAKHLRDQKPPELFVIPHELRLSDARTQRSS